MFHMSAILPAASVALRRRRRVPLDDRTSSPAPALAHDRRASGATWLSPTFPTVTQALLDHPGSGRATCRRIARCINTSRRRTRCARCRRDAARRSRSAPTAAPSAAGSSRSTSRPTTPEQRATTCGRAVRRASRCGSSTPRPGATCAPGERGEIVVRGLRPVRGLPQRPGADRGAHRRRRLVPHRRPRRARRRTAASPSSGAPRTCSRSAARTSPRVEIESLPRAPIPAVRARRRSSASPTRGTSRSPPPSSSSRPGATATAEELIAHCRGQVASFKVPRHVRFVDRVADVGDEDPEVPAARAARRGARGRAHGRGARVMAAQPLEGMAGLVTGAGRGIGLAIAERLAAQGAQVCVADVDPAPAEEAAARIGGTAMAVAGDVADADDCERMVRAGGGALRRPAHPRQQRRPDPRRDGPQDERRRLGRVDDVVLRGTFNCVRAAAPWLRVEGCDAQPRRSSTSPRSIGIYGSRRQPELLGGEGGRGRADEARSRASGRAPA